MKNLNDKTKVNLVANFISAVVILFSLNLLAIEGIVDLETRLIEKNSELQSMKSLVSVSEMQVGGAYSEFYPTINAAGGWAQNSNDELSSVQKGYVGYLEGRFNLFKGFKDTSVLQQRSVDVKLSQVEYELKKRHLRYQLIEVVSEIALLHELEKIINEEEKTTESQKQMAAKKVLAGLTGSVDSLEFELRETEINIEKKQIQQRHHEAHQKMIALFGEEIHDSEFDKINFSEINYFSKYLNDEIDIERNIEVENKKLIYEKTQFEKQEIRSDFLPSLDFTFAYGRLTPVDESTLKMNESKYALILTIPLFSGFNSYYKTRSLNQKMIAADHDKIQKIRDIRSEFGVLRTKLKQLIDLYNVNEKKILTINQYFNFTLAEYKRGIKNSPDLVSATERLFSSKKKKIEILQELELLHFQISNLATL